jgi:hypothetical protein
MYHPWLTYVNEISEWKETTTLQKPLSSQEANSTLYKIQKNVTPAYKIVNTFQCFPILYYEHKRYFKAIRATVGIHKAVGFTDILKSQAVATICFSY